MASLFVLNVLPQRFGKYGLYLHPDESEHVAIRHPNANAPYEYDVNPTNRAATNQTFGCADFANRTILGRNSGDSLYILQDTPMSAAHDDRSISPTASTQWPDDGPLDRAAEPSPLIDLKGAVLRGRYELGRVMGAGGMGAVFEARDRVLDRKVAVKVIKPELSDRGDYIRRFLREAQAASKIRHRNVVVNLDYGEADGLLYSVMELLEGKDLKQVLGESPRERLPWVQTRELLIQIASGLKAAHDQGVIHRDIKPANCFLTEEDEQPVIKLVDFGIAKFDDSPEDDQITRTSQVLGTPSYIPPELMRTRKSAGPRSDVYSLGVMAYRMLTGNLPFVGETAFEVMYRACTDTVPSLRLQVPDLPAEVEELLLSMLAKDPTQRPSDMAEVRQKLQMLPGHGSRRRPWGWIGIGGVTVVAGLGVVAWSMTGGSGDYVSEHDERAPRLIDPPIALAESRGPVDAPATPVVDADQVNSRENPVATEVEEEHSDDSLDGLEAETISFEPEAEHAPKTRKRPPTKTKRERGAPKRASARSTSNVRSPKSDAQLASRACGREHESLMSTVTIEFEVKEDGTVESTRVLPPMTMAPVGFCVADAVSKLQFPKGEQGKTKWKLPL